MTATERALVALLDGPRGCGEVGSMVWEHAGFPRRGRVSSVNGGGDVWRARARRAMTVERDEANQRVARKVAGQARRRAKRKGGPVLRARTLLELPTGRRRPAGKKGGR